MSRFGWISLLIIGLAFLIPVKGLLETKAQGGDVSWRYLLQPPWKWEGWTWKFPDADDPYHDAKLIMFFGFGLMVFMLVGLGLLVGGAVALTHHLWWLGWPLLILSLLTSLLMVGFVGMRLWVDFGRPFKRWLARRRA